MSTKRLTIWVKRWTRSCRCQDSRTLWTQRVARVQKRGNRGNLVARQLNFCQTVWCKTLSMQRDKQAWFSCTLNYPEADIHTVRQTDRQTERKKDRQLRVCRSWQNFACFGRHFFYLVARQINIFWGPGESASESASADTVTTAGRGLAATVVHLYVVSSKHL